MVPTEIVIYIEEIRKFTDFKQLDPIFVVKFVFGFDLKQYLITKKVQMTKASETSGFKSGSILENLRIPIFILLIALVVLLLAIILMVLVRSPKIKSKIKKILNEKK